MSYSELVQFLATTNNRINSPDPRAAQRIGVQRRGTTLHHGTGRLGLRQSTTIEIGTAMPRPLQRLVRRHAGIAWPSLRRGVQLLIDAETAFTGLTRFVARKEAKPVQPLVHGHATNASNRIVTKL